MRAIFLASLVAGTALADNCALPDPALPSSADPDLGRTMEILGALVVASKNDAARVTADPASLGRELESLENDGRPVATAVRPLLSRLRRLDCAALAGEPTLPKAFADLTDEAGQLILRLSNAAAPVAPPEAVYIPAPVVLPPPPPPFVLPPLSRPSLVVDPRRSARSLLRAAYAFFAVSAGLMVIATGLTADGAVDNCDDCFLDLHEVEKTMGIAVFVMGGLALIGATSFMIAGHSELRKLRLTPTASVGKDSNVFGLRGSF